MTNKLPLPRFIIAGIVLTIFSFIPVLGLVFLLLAIIFLALSFKSFKVGKNRGRGLMIGTLVILLISILWNIIFGLQAGLSVYVGYKDREQEVKEQLEQLDVSMFETIVSTYQYENFRCPTTVSEITSKFSKEHTGGFENISYSLSEDKKKFEIRSPGHDNVVGTNDDIVRSGECNN